MSAQQPTNADISREFRQDIGEIKTSFGKIETKLNFHFIGFVLLLGIMVWLHTDQNSRINRVEGRLEAKITALDAKIDGLEERIISRLETVFAN